MEYGDYLIEVLAAEEGKFIARITRKDGRHFKIRSMFLFEMLAYADTAEHSTKEEAIEEAKLIVAASKPQWHV